MRKGLRSSASKKAEEKEKLDDRAKVTKKSFELQNIIEDNKESLDKDIEELCSTNPEQSSSDESVVRINKESDSEDEFESPKSQRTQLPRSTVTECFILPLLHGHIWYQCMQT